MPEPVLVVLKLCALALLYLFFIRVTRAVWAEVRAPGTVAAPAAGGATGAPARRRDRRRAGGPPSLVVVEPPEHRGRRYELDQEATMGRASGCQVTIDDSFVSQIHARVYQQDGSLYVEDLGSTNGTFVNDRPVTRATALGKGDRLRLGGTVLEVRP